MQLRLYVILIVVAVLVFAAVLFVRNRPAYQQSGAEVVIREPGDRLLGSPQPVGPEAQQDLRFAWLSQAAYEKIPSAIETSPGADCLDPGTALEAAGWSPWPDFPDRTLQDEIGKSHLRVDVWRNPASGEVAVAFGGTVAKSLQDWEANLRWFIPWHDDEYTKLVKLVGPKFVEEFIKRKQEPGWEFLNHATIYATGHSLGGGLAQQFAYSLPIDPGVPRVAHVFAFDPSPVTGYTSVNKVIRTANRQELKIDRVYERGEILAILRSFTNTIDPPRATAPVIRQVRYNLFPRINPISGHSISELACKLDKATRN
jgi:hypothetical protein